MSNQDVISPENLVYKKPTLMNDVDMHYCPGCSHGVVHKLVAEVIEEMGMEEKTVGVSPVGCGVFAYRYLDIDWQEAAHSSSNRYQALVARPSCVYLSRRWRLGLYRYMRNNSCIEQR